MAAAITNFIDRIQLGSDEANQIAIGSSAYGVCSTAANEAAKTVSIPGFTLNAGTTIHIKFTYANTASSSPTLNVSNTGAKAIVSYGSTTAGTNVYSIGWQAGAILTLTYDGTSWVRSSSFNELVIPSVICETAGTTAAKVASSDQYVLQSGNIFEFTLVNTNTVANTLTLSINGTTTKPIYINGNASSSINYSIPAGKYIMFYDGSAYHIRTDEKAPISISGSAGSVDWNNVENVPNNFTPSSHTHGNIENDGTIENAVTVSTGDQLLIGTGSTDHNSINLSNIAFDTSSGTATALSEAGTWVSVVNSIGGHSGVITLQDLGLDSALRFIGITSTSLTEGASTSTIRINNADYPPSGSTLKSGDVVMDSQSLREYLWDGSSWHLLGFTISSIYNSDNITAATSSNYTWLSKITQNTDGTIAVERKSIDTLPITYGGTGTSTSSLTQYGIIYADTTTSYDVTSAGADGTPLIAHGSATSSGSRAPSWYDGISFTGAGTTSDPYLAAAQGNVTVGGTLSVTGTSTLSGNVGIGMDPDTSLSNSNRLSINGSIAISLTATAAYLKPSNTNSVATYLEFYPAADNTGYIGITDNRWQYGYYNNLLTPSLTLDTSTSGESNWTINNSSGVLSINNGASDNNLIELSGTDYGFILKTKLYINETISNNSNLDFYVSGKSQLNDKVGIGGAPDSATTGDIHILKITGATLIADTSGVSVAHLDPFTESNIHSLEFYPTTESSGYIGTGSYPWQYGYFSDMLSINNGTTSILLTTTDTNDIATIAMTASEPAIELNTTASGKSSWKIYNTDQGVFTLTNQASSNPVQFIGTDNGFEMTHCLYINESISSNPLNLYVNGKTELNGKVGIGTVPDSSTGSDSHILTIQGNTLIKNSTTTVAHLNINTNNELEFIPQSNNTGYLGTTSTRWRKLYLGNADAYGDEYIPIYWNEGVPAAVTVIQQASFTLYGKTQNGINAGYAKIGSNANVGSNTQVVEIVVTSGMSYLQSPIDWEIITESNTKKIQLHAAIDDGDSGNYTVSGYILFAK